MLGGLEVALQPQSVNTIAQTRAFVILAYILTGSYMGLSHVSRMSSQE